jgi:predicted esterase YcpF (UPF0227 family)
MYLHGFGSSGQSNTVTYLKKLMPDCRVVAPDIPIDPKDALPFLKGLCKKKKPDVIIGTSMGGMYAMQLVDYPRICVNPALRMTEQSKNLTIGKHDYFHPTANGETTFAITDEIISHFREMEEHMYDEWTKENRRFCWGFFGDEDEIARCEDEFEEHFPSNVFDYHGGHRMNNSVLKNIIVPFIYDLFEELNI